jgi:RNA polymerase sigma-70 factor (ECF subfamily)
LHNPSSERIRELFERYGPLVLRRAQRLLGNVHDAEEATQEIFIRALRGAEAFEQRSQITTWLYQITTHHCLNLLRDRARRRELRAEHPEPAGGEQAPAPSDEVAIVRRLLADADPRQAQAAVYVFVDGMSHEEAAELLGVSKRTVGNLVERFRAWARERSALPDDAAPAPALAAGRGPP